MKKFFICVLLCFCTITHANCDLTQFRWGCRIPIQPKHTKHTPSVIDCGGTNVYVTPQQYNVIMRYQRANVNMALKVNGEYVTSPCVPAGYTGLSLH